MLQQPQQQRNASAGLGGRKGSVIAEQYDDLVRRPREGGIPPERPPTNEEMAKAVQQRVAAAVELSRKYRHVAWYSLFVASYMVVLYFQANAYKSGEVVAALKQAFMPNGQTTMTFKSEGEVLAYLGNQVLLPIWKDPVCGDANCEWPWEYPAWGRFGCKADCGMNPNTTQIAVNVRADFTGHPSISPRTLMSNAKWNLCLDDPVRRQRGEADLCWFESDLSFTSTVVNSIDSMMVIDGKWYVVVKGDYAGRVSGAVYDLTNDTLPVAVATSPSWDSCKLSQRKTVSATTTAMRRLLQAYTQAHQAGGESGKQIIQDAVAEIQAMPQLRHVNFSQYNAVLNRQAVSAEPLPGTVRSTDQQQDS